MDLQGLLLHALVAGALACPRALNAPCSACRRRTAAAGHAVFDGRTLEGHAIKATYVLEDEYARAAAGEWVNKQT